VGDYTDMILDGTLCQVCGCYLGDGDGFPVTCTSCGGDWEDDNDEQEGDDA